MKSLFLQAQIPAPPFAAADWITSIQKLRANGRFLR